MSTNSSDKAGRPKSASVNLLQLWVQSNITMSEVRTKPKVTWIESQESTEVTDSITLKQRRGLLWMASQRCIEVLFLPDSIRLTVDWVQEQKQRTGNLVRSFL